VERDHTTGGSRQLGELIDECGAGALYYELTRLGVDLTDVFRGKRSPRSILWLTEHMPADSAVAAAASGNPALRDWGLTPVLLAGIFNRLADVAIAAAQPHIRKKLTRPKPVLPPVAKRRRRTGRVLDKLPPLPS